MRVGSIALLITFTCLLPSSGLAKCVRIEKELVIDLSRKVVSPDGKPISNAKVLVQTLDGKVVFKAESDGDGLYRITGLQSGEYGVVVKSDRYIQHEYKLVISGGTSDSISEVELRPNSECHDMYVIPDDQ